MNEDAKPVQADDFAEPLLSDDEFWPFLSAAKGEPYTRDEWETEVKRLRYELLDAEKRLAFAQENGRCVASRFSHELTVGS